MEPAELTGTAEKTQLDIKNEKDIQADKTSSDSISEPNRLLRYGENEFYVKLIDIEGF